jgi:sterile alpha motif and leucine zipper-containing kinase AZK
MKLTHRSYAMVLWEMMTREYPWAGMQAAQIFYAVAALGKRPIIPADCPKLFTDLIVR